MGVSHLGPPSLQAQIDELNKVLDDKLRLVRELDVALHGEEGAAEQASLCDLIGPAKKLRASLAAAEERAERLDEELSLAYLDWICGDCKSHGPFKMKRIGSPIDGDELVSICGKCGSENTGEPADFFTDDELLERAEKAEAERDEARAGLEGVAVALGWTRQRAWETQTMAHEVAALRSRVAELEKALAWATKQLGHAPEMSSPLEWARAHIRLAGAGGEGRSTGLRTPAYQRLTPATEDNTPPSQDPERDPNRHRPGP